MKKTLILALCAVVAAHNVFAAENTETRLKEMLKDSLMPSFVDYKGDISLTPQEDGYKVNVPLGTVKDTNNMVPAFSAPVRKVEAKGDDAVYRLSLNKLIQIFPVLAPFLEHYPVTYDSLDFTMDLVPDKSYISRASAHTKNLVVPVEQNVKLVFGKIDEEDVIERENDNAKITKNTVLSDIQLSHLFGNVKIDKVLFESFGNSSIEAARKIEVTPSLKDLNQSGSWQAKTYVNKVEIDSLFTKAHFGAQTNGDLKIDDDKQVNFTLDMKATDIYVSEQPDVPEKVLLNVNLSGFTVDQFMDWEAAFRAFNEVQDLPASNAQETLAMQAYQDLQEKQAAFLKNFVVKVNEVRLDSDKYTISLKGVGELSKEQFTGTLTVVNFNYLAPEPKKVDEKACQEVMNKVLDGSLKGDAFEAAFNEKCNDRKGILDALRPYASTAKRTTFEGKDALEFDIKFKEDELFVNSRPFSVQ